MPAEPETPLGESPAFLKVLEETSQVAPLDKPVLIVGERGTGKELIAERLHFLSNRSEDAFLKMNCAAISEALLESELFGHEAAPSPAQPKPTAAASSGPTAAPCFWTNWPTPRLWCRKSCCG